MTLATLIKFRDVGYILVIMGLIIWSEGLSLRLAGMNLKIVGARLEAIEKADRLSNELIIEQAKTLGQINQKAIGYGNQIRNAPAGQAGDTERFRAGNRGVRDIVTGGSE